MLGLGIVHGRRLAQTRRRVEALTKGGDGGGPDGVLDRHLDPLQRIGHELDDLSARSAVLEANGRRAFQRVGFIRFNPFEDTGGNQSFAVALLDAHGDGFVLSSLHARNGTRVYAKSVAAGKAEAALSHEESQALRSALGDGQERGRAAS